jgi:hypothetical protein
MPPGPDHAVNAILDAIFLVGRGFAALVAGLLPRRRWHAFPGLPIERLAVPSGLLTFALGAALGAFGFMDYARRAAEGVANATLHIAARQVRHEIPGDISTVATQGVSALSLFAFAFFTPLGLFSLYLIVTGILRAVATVVDDPFGDPILTGIDRLVTRSAHDVRQARARQARQRQEGIEVPDRLLTADSAHAAGFDYVVVSSRRKPDWTPGTFVITNDKWYTLGEAFEVRLPEGLRTVYPLKEQRVVEVLRRGVPYELPPLEQGRLGDARAGRERPPTRT